MKRICANCGARVPKKQQLYELKIEMFAECGPIEIDPEDLQEDQIAKLEQLIDDMEHIDPEEAADEVYETYSFALCARCRQRIHKGLKEKSKLV